MKRTFVIGLDCLEPSLALDRWAADLPNLARLRDGGTWGRLASTIPPITVPAWMCMMTGRDPGVLGIYGFRNRRDHSYDRLSFASSAMVHERTVWDLLAERGLRSTLLGIPLTWPPREVNGLLVGDFLAPDTGVEYTWPPELRNEISGVVGDYMLDVRDFRTDNKEWLLDQIRRMSKQRFDLAKHLASAHPWDLFMMVEMGPDRMHHGFWRYFDTEHREYQPGSQWERSMHDYYVFIDELVGDLVSTIPQDARVMVVSDHGATRMDGGICINEWLIEHGYLSLKSYPSHVEKLDPENVDWERTRAWGDGGYYGRLFMNVAGREPRGQVTPEAAGALRAELKAGLELLGDEHGVPIGTVVYEPESVYEACNNVPPDLIVYFGNLNWRSVGSIGHRSMWTRTNDTGPDDANHDRYGVFILNDRDGTGHGQRDDLTIYDVAPTLLDGFGLSVETGMSGRPVVPRSVNADGPWTPAQEAELARRLEDLGYI